MAIPKGAEMGTEAASEVGSEACTSGVLRERWDRLASSLQGRSSALPLVEDTDPSSREDPLRSESVPYPRRKSAPETA